MTTTPEPSPLTEARLELTAAARVAVVELEDVPGLEVTVYDHVPTSPTLPAVIVQAADPWLAPGERFDEWSVALEVVLLVDLVDNETATTDLEHLAAAVLPAIPPGYGVDRVGRPGPLHTADWLAHGVTVTVSRFATL